MQGQYMLESAIDNLQLKSGIPGVHVSVWSSEINFELTRGFKSSRTKEKLNKLHKIPISCLMKVLISCICAEFCYKGILNIDEPVEKYLPELYGNKNVLIKVRDILSHTSGYKEPKAKGARWGCDWSRFVDFYKCREQVFYPGDVWSYCHTGFVIIQKILESITSEKIDKILREEIFEPLEINPVLLGDGSVPREEYAALHMYSGMNQKFEPMRPPTENGFFRYSISDYCISLADITRITHWLCERYSIGFVPGDFDLSSIEIPPYVRSNWVERMPSRYGLGIGGFGSKMLGINGSYVGSTLSSRFDVSNNSGYTIALNAWHPQFRDRIAHEIEEVFGFSSDVHDSPGPMVPDLTLFEGKYDGLMLESTSCKMSVTGKSLLCHISRHDNQTQLVELRQSDDGIIEFVDSENPIAISFFETKNKEPVVMIGTSAFKKV